MLTVHNSLVIASNVDRVLAAYLLLVVTVPIFTPDLYPFSRFPMFSDRPTEAAFVAVFDKDDRQVPAYPLGLHDNRRANPHAKTGIIPKASVWDDGFKLDRDEINANLKAWLDQNPDRGPLKINVQLADTNDGVLKVRVDETWTYGLGADG